MAAWCGRLVNQRMTTAQPLACLVPADPALTGEFERIDAVGKKFVWFVAAVWVAGVFGGFIPAVTVLTVAGFLAAIVGLTRPVIGIFGVGMLCTLDALSRVFLLTGGLLRWNSFNYLMIVALLLAPGLALKLADGHTRILAAFALLLTLQLSITPDMDGGLHTMLNVFAPFGILLYFRRTEYNTRAVVWLGAISGMLGALGGLVYFVQADALPEMNKNAWSAFPLTSLFCICFAYGLVPREFQIRLGALAAVNTVWVFLSGSRGGMFIGVICLLFLLVRTRSVEHKLILFVAGPAIAGVLLMLFSNVTDTSLHRVTMLFDSDRALESRTSGRSDLYIAGWRMFRENPFGVGTGGFPKEFAKMADRDLSFTGRELGAHSAWIKVLTENGVFGIIVLTAYVVSFAAAGLTSGRQDYAATGILVTLILASAFFSREFHSKGLWLAAATYIALTRDEERARRLM